MSNTHATLKTSASSTSPITSAGIREAREPVTLPSDYRPSEKEPFMNPRHLEYFRQKLVVWRKELLKGSEKTLENLQDGGPQEADLADRASTEVERGLELRTRDRARKLISKIDAALERIEDGSYGLCEETGEPITLKRLEARPVATLSIDAQERHERFERIQRSGLNFQLAYSETP
jgi:DnaK suppressor protein